ncbi:MAG: tetratricopeptide repeat protein [Atribacterota bacterium]
MMAPSAGALEPLDQAQLNIENGDYEKAITLLTPLLDSNNQEELSQVVQALYNVYSEQERKKDTQNVLQVFINKFPTAPDAYLFRYWSAKIEEENQNYTGSLAMLQEIIASFPQDMEDTYNLREQAMEDVARHYQYHLEKYQEAIDWYLKILADYPNFDGKSSIRSEIASCYEKMGNFQQALNFYQQIFNDETDPFYRQLAELRVEYLKSDPRWARKNPDDLITELEKAFTDKDLSTIESLAKKGDFWTGQIYSEYELGRFSPVKKYLETYLPQSNPRFSPVEKKNNMYSLRIEQWADPEYDILYLEIEKGIFGWEWSNVILSNHQLEDQINSQ